MKKPLPIMRAIDITASFMSLEGMNDLDYFICGSIRRDLDEVGDVDLIVVGKFPESGYCERYKESGKSKMRTYNYKQAQINMWTSSPERLGASLLYATGSGRFNTVLRSICISKGYKLSQYGLFDRKTDALLASESEQDILNKLDLKYIPPSYRQSKRVSSTIRAFKLRDGQEDLSYITPLSGRVFDRTKYSQKQQSWLPVDQSHIVPHISKGVDMITKLGFKKD